MNKKGWMEIDAPSSYQAGKKNDFNMVIMFCETKLNWMKDEMDVAF